MRNFAALLAVCGQASRLVGSLRSRQIIIFINNPKNMKYETVFILTPVLSDAQMKEAVEKFSKVLTDNGASIVNTEEWGMRKLAYPIQKKSTGFYTLVEFEGDTTLVKKLETAFRRDERVLRFLVFRQDKYAAEYAAKRRSLKAAKATEATQPVEAKED